MAEVNLRGEEETRASFANNWAVFSADVGEPGVEDEATAVAAAPPFVVSRNSVEGDDDAVRRLVNDGTASADPVVVEEKKKKEGQCNPAS